MSRPWPSLGKMRSAKHTVVLSTNEVRGSKLNYAFRGPYITTTTVAFKKGTMRSECMLDECILTMQSHQTEMTSVKKRGHAMVRGIKVPLSGCAVEENDLSMCLQDGTRVSFLNFQYSCKGALLY